MNDAFLYGRQNLLTMIIDRFNADGTVQCRAIASKILGTYRQPFEVPREECEVTAEVNRQFVTTGSPYYKQLDPMAPYLPGDKVAVMEQWIPFWPSRKMPNVHTPEGVMDFITNPTPYYDRGVEPAGFKTAYWLIGRWRDTSPAPSPNQHTVNQPPPPPEQNPPYTP